MTTISAINAHDGASYRPMGIHRAVLSRQANLGDCVDAPSVFKRLLSRGYLRRPSCVIPISRKSRPEPSAADLAVDVSRRLLERASWLSRDDIGAIIYCHAVPDEKLSESTAGRVQFELGLHRANPFSISQSHNIALLIGLDLALGLVEGPEAASNVLLVASDKLLFGGPASSTNILLFGDVAAAALISKGKTAGWCVEHLGLHHFTTTCAAMSMWPAESIREFVSFSAEIVTQTLLDSGLAPTDLSAVITSMPDAGFVAELHRSANLPPQFTQHRVPTRGMHASSADLLIALHAVENFVPAHGSVLAWACGNNGEFACCVLRRT